MHKITFTTCLRLLLGVLILSEFFLYLNNQFFTVTGFMSTLEFLRDYNQYSLFKWIISLFHNSAHVIPWYYLFAVIILLTAVSLITGIWVQFFNYISFLFFLILFICHEGVEGTWLFEFVLRFGVAYLVLENQIKQRKHQDKKIISGDLARINIVSGVVCIVIISLFVYWVNLESKNFISKNNSQLYILIFSVCVFLLLLLNLILSKLVCKKDDLKKYDEFFHQKILDKCAIFLGIMLATQVKLDTLLSWFTIIGYDNLIDNYQKYSSVTQGSRFFTEFIKDHSVIAVPLQASVEAFLALCLMTLIFRPISYLLSGLLFLALALIELGVPSVPSNLPVHMPSYFSVTWAWDLLPSAFVMLLITYYDCFRFLREKNNKLKLVGCSIFNNLSLYKRLFYTVLVCVLLFIVTSFAHRNPKNSDLVFMLSIGSTVTVFLYLCLFHLLDILKHKN